MNMQYRHMIKNINRVVTTPIFPSFNTNEQSIYTHRHISIASFRIGSLTDKTPLFVLVLVAYASVVSRRHLQLSFTDTSGGITS